MAIGAVYYNGILAGHLQRTADGMFTFYYLHEYLADASLPAISLTLPKQPINYENNRLFPFFSGLLSEGINKDIQCRLLKIDENDDFTRLLNTAGADTIGAITVKPLPDEL